MTLWWWWRTTCRWSRDMNTSLSSYLDVTLSTWIQIVDQTWMFKPKSHFQIFSSFTLLALWSNRRETKARDEIKIKAVFHNTFVFRFWKYIASPTFHHPMTWWACFWRCFWWQCNEPLSPSQSQCWGIHISKITLQPKSKSKEANIFYQFHNHQHHHHHPWWFITHRHLSYCAKYLVTYTTHRPCSLSL